MFANIPAQDVGLVLGDVRELVQKEQMENKIEMNLLDVSVPAVCFAGGMQMPLQPMHVGGGCD